MYDSVNDILLASYAVPMFDPHTESLLDESVLVLWMVLHYRNFCEGIRVQKVADHCRGIDFRSHFQEKAGTKWSVYTGSLRENVKHFPSVMNKVELDYKIFLHCKKVEY